MKIEELCKLKANKPDTAIFNESKRRWDCIAKPLDGLGRFEEMICRIASIKKNADVSLDKKALVIMCSDNGIVNRGVTQTGQSVTKDVAVLMSENKSSVGIMTKAYPLDIFPVDVGINADIKKEGLIDRKISKGTKDFSLEPAMTKDQCMEAISAGIDMANDLFKKGYDIIATGEMGIGNTTTSTALLCALAGLKSSQITGRGAGLSDKGLQLKIKVIDDALKKYKLGSYVDPGCSNDKKVDTFKALCVVGGYDIAALAGLFIGCAINGLPIIIDGAISAVSALTASYIVPGCEDYMLASHMGKEKSVAVVLNILGLKGVIDADLALGEGSGAVMLFPLLDMAHALYMHGTGFNETKIDSYKRL